MFRFAVAIGIVVVLAGVGAAPAEAGLLGKSLDAVYYDPNTSTPYPSAVFTPETFVIGPGQETVGNVEGVTNILVDFADSSLTIKLVTTLASPTWNSEPFNGVIFTSPAPLGITGAAVDAATTMTGFDDSRVGFNADQILIDWGGLSYLSGTVVKVDFATASDVPEPASFALLGTGLLAAGLARRRARR